MSIAPAPAPAGSENAARAMLCELTRTLADAHCWGPRPSLSMRWHRGVGDGVLIAPPRLTSSIDDISWLPLANAASAQDSVDQASSDNWLQQPLEPLVQHLYCTEQTDAVLFVQSPYATTLACTEPVQQDGIGAIHPLIKACGANRLLCAALTSPDSAPSLSAIDQALSGRCACLIANRGLLVTGPSVSAVIETAKALEFVSRLYWQAAQTGAPVLPGAAT